MSHLAIAAILAAKVWRNLPAVFHRREDPRQRNACAVESSADRLLLPIRCAFRIIRASDLGH